MSVRHLDVRLPILALVTPVTRVGAREPVYVVDEPLRGKQRLALHALYARGKLLRVQFGHAHSARLAEHVVEHLERERDHVVGDRDGRRRNPVQQREAQPLRVRFGHQATRRRGHWQYLTLFEHVQLFGRAPRTVNAQFIAHLVDLRKREVPEHGVEDLRQAQPHLTAHHEARDLLPFQFGFEQLTARLIRHVQHRVQRRLCRWNWRLPTVGQRLGVTGATATGARATRARVGAGRHRGLGRADSDRSATDRLVQHRVRALQAPSRAYLIRFQHFLDVRIVHLLFITVIVVHRFGRASCRLRRRRTDTRAVLYTPPTRILLTRRVWWSEIGDVPACGNCTVAIAVADLTATATSMMTLTLTRKTRKHGRRTRTIGREQSPATELTVRTAVAWVASSVAPRRRQHQRYPANGRTVVCC